MEPDTEGTIYQQLACLKRTGHPFTLKPYEGVRSVDDKGDTIVVVMDCVDLVERSTGFEIRRTGVRMVIFKQGADKFWTRDSITSWDEFPNADYIRTWGQSVTPQIYRDRMSWAMDCFRPGTDRFPLDNADRTFIGAEHSTARMKAHWGVKY